MNSTRLNMRVLIMTLALSCAALAALWPRWRDVLGAQGYDCKCQAEIREIAGHISAQRDPTNKLLSFDVEIRSLTFGEKPRTGPGQLVQQAFVELQTEYDAVCNGVPQPRNSAKIRILVEIQRDDLTCPGREFSRQFLRQLPGLKFSAASSLQTTTGCEIKNLELFLKDVNVSYEVTAEATCGVARKPDKKHGKIKLEPKKGDTLEGTDQKPKEKDKEKDKEKKKEK